jgi:hypothetical protein
MKVNRLAFPLDRYDTYWTDEEFSKYDFDELVQYSGGKIEEIWYWYGAGSYEGDGQLTARFEDGRWGLASLGHCSCYGPCDGGVKPTANSAEELYAPLTEDYRRILEPMMNAVLAKG